MDHETWDEIFHFIIMLYMLGDWIGYQIIEKLSIEAWNKSKKYGVIFLYGRKIQQELLPRIWEASIYHLFL